MPVAINTSRPPSTASVPGAPRTTTTSRRGGRTRSRSPAVMGGRPPSDVPAVMGGEPPNNPSSAAAAAAAAAKAYSSSRPWPPPSEKDDYHHPHHPPPHHHPHHPHHPPGGGANFEKPSRWPSEDPYRRYPPSQQPPPPYRGREEYSDRRYRPHRYDHPHDRRYGGRPHHPSYPPDYRYDQGPPPRPGSSSKNPPPPQPQSQRSGGTSLIIGGSTPIHVPKKPVYEQQRSAASVFRGRPESSTPPNGNNKDDEDSPQKILLSLRTPTTSFEEAKPANKNRGLTLSPDDPPPLHNSSHNNNGSNSNNKKTDQLLERSPEGGSKTALLDSTNSFVLFNQSFDSFGDGNYFNVDSSLQADSFGMTRTNSIDMPDNGAASILRKNSSVGNASHQLLTAGSGALTIGYSPVNSFGGASAAPARRGNMMVLDGRSPSPTQVLGMYRSYSGGGGRPEMMDDMRLSSGSFGGGPPPPRSFGGEAQSPSYYQGERPPSFYILLRKYKMAFKDCSFLLPGLKAALLETSVEKMEEASRADKWDTSKPMPGDPYHVAGRYAEPLARDIVVARRRVESSICAFGGQINRDDGIAATMMNKERNKSSSIFRTKEDPDGKPVPVTPSSSSGSEHKSQARLKYEEALGGRYYENDNRLSWEFEESPPVGTLDHTPPDDLDGSMKSEPHTPGRNTPNGKGKPDSKNANGTDGSVQYCMTTNESEEEVSKSGSASPQPKMRYRCKLCGQPKQNHRCPYQQSLARSIGVMVYPAVNAFTSSEPGTLAAPLSEMNNFVDLKDSQSMDGSSPSRPTPENMRRLGTTAGSTTQVTPESMRSSNMHSPASFASPARPGSRHKRSGGRSGGSTASDGAPAGSSTGKKRSYSQATGGGAGSTSENPDDLLFMEPMELKQEQFRMIAPIGKPKDGKKPYTYPSLPLPYAQRKRLSDNLFSLSNDVPKLTDECAQVLREAREKDAWDVAVAELMTQVIVIVHCPDGDHRFEGLRQYLLTLGIAC